MRDIKVCWNNMYLQGRADWEKGEGGGGGGGGRGFECKCIELVASTRKWKRLNQTIKILPSGDLGVI